MKYAVFAGLALAAAVPAQAALIDDFNRANGPLGANYAEQNSGLSILNNQVVGQFASLSTYNGSSSTTAGIDVALRGADRGSFVALALGFNSGQSYFIKVQDENGDGFFDSYAFFEGNNDFVGGGIRSLSSAFQTGSFDVSYTGTVASLVINANGGVQNYSYDYGYAPGSTDVGLGINRQGVADNLRFEQSGTPAIPEPATWAMLIGGFGMIGGALRSRRRSTAFA